MWVGKGRLEKEGEEMGLSCGERGVGRECRRDGCVALGEYIANDFV